MRSLSLRGRLTIGATVVVAVALVALSGVLLVAVRHSVLGSLDGSARQQGKDVAALVRSGRVPDPLPVGAGTAGVQVVDAEGRVSAVSAGTDRLTALLEPGDLAAVRAGGVRVVSGARLGTPDALRVVGVPVPASAAPTSSSGAASSTGATASTAAVGGSSGSTVLVAVSAAEAEGTVRALGVAVAVGGPVLLLGFALACWVLVGRALDPVARLRVGAERISAAGWPDGQRLPVPEAQDELQRLATTLNGMLGQLERASRSQRAFVADAAHELRSPLTAIRTQLEVARAHPGTAADWDDAAAGVLADAERLSRLVDDLLLLARTAGPGSGPGVGGVRRPLVTQVTEVDLGDLARDVAASAGWRVPVEVDPLTPRTGAVRLSTDADAVRRVLVNLVDNAVRHAGTGVVISVDEQPDQVRVAVTDDGPGIAEADRERVFERFTRLEESRARADLESGSGLGLAIVRGLVTAAGGRVWVEPASGSGVTSGTRAVVTWPRAVPDAGD